MIDAGSLIECSATENALETYLELFTRLSNQPVFDLPSAAKKKSLLPILDVLENFHRIHCPEYRYILEGRKPCKNTLESLTKHLNHYAYLAVRLFKTLDLKSIGQSEVFRTLQSSGTTGQVTAKIALDKATSQRQSRALVHIMQQILGKQRLPMLIIDSADIMRNNSKFNARVAGIQGMAFFGRNHTYALDENMKLNWDVIESFCDKYRGQKVLIFGFTFMIWQYLVKALREQSQTIELPKAVLIHSGGWKKLESEKVDNQTFKHVLNSVTSIDKVHNFYGMAEQVGSVFVECSEGHLHAPSYADILVRDPYTLEPVPFGKAGLIQVLSCIPTSYPGHSILTEDMGIIHGEDDCPCGWSGKYFSVQGRLPKAEVRGCSDTQVLAGNGVT